MPAVGSYPYNCVCGVPSVRPRTAFPCLCGTNSCRRSSPVRKRARCNCTTNDVSPCRGTAMRKSRVSRGNAPKNIRPARAYMSCFSPPHTRRRGCFPDPSRKRADSRCSACVDGHRNRHGKHRLEASSLLPFLRFMFLSSSKFLDAAHREAVRPVVVVRRVDVRGVRVQIVPVRCTVR